VLALLPILTARAATSDVEIEDSGFSPDEVSINPGDKVEWTNRGDERHTVTADDSSFDSGELEPEENFRWRFQEAGTYFRLA
jgi:Plastocyanin